MEKFKVGDIVTNKSNDVVEILSTTVSLRGKIVSHSKVGEYNADYVENLRHATKDEKIRFYEDKMKEYQANIDEDKSIKNEPVWPLPSGDFWSYYQDGFIEKCYKTHDRGTNQALSEKRAIQLYEKSKLMQDMYLWVDTFCPDWVPDYKNKYQTKYGLDAGMNACISSCWCYNVFVFGVSVPTKELGLKMLCEFKDRIEEWY